MKTTKNKTKVNSEMGSSSTIQTFFKPAPKESKKRQPSTNVKSVYVHALLDKLQSSDDDDATSNKSDLAQISETVNTAPKTQPPAYVAKKDKSNRCETCAQVDKSDGCVECDKWRKKYEDVKRSHIKLSVRYTELMMKYDELAEVAKGSVRPNLNSENNTDGPQILSIANGIASQTLSTSAGVAQSLCQPNDIFTENEITCLKCLPLDKNKDSTFILNCLQYAYKNNAASIATKTLKGTTGRFEVSDSGDLIEVIAAKDPLTPKKVQRIHQLFMDRVTKSKCMAVEFAERVKETYFNRLIASAVKNMSNKVIPSKKTPSNQNKDINL